VSVTLEVAHNLPHVWPLFQNLLPEAGRTLDMLSIWIEARTSTR
jgi:monoterpene epsilon-lactone hydrolase